MREIVTLAVSIATTLGALRGVEVREFDEYPVPPTARMLLNNVKSDLRDLTVCVLRQQPPSAAVAAGSAEQALHDVLASAGAFEACDSAYGSLEAPKVTAPADDLIAVVTTLDIPCGDDSSLLLFRRAGDGWKLVYDRTRSDYNDITDAAGYFQYRISEPDARGARLVLAAEVNPHCQSNWQRVRWDVARINPGQAPAQPIARGQDGIFLGGEEEGPDLFLTPDTFGLEFVGSSIDIDRMTRMYRRHYRVAADGSTERIEPIADSPTDYVDEWLGNDHRPFGTFQEVTLCGDNLWRVPFEEDGKMTYYFVAEDDKGVYRMVSIGGKP